jgi:NAD(P)-dependent dehydrogenase (short-subunit alcohol dehydrogenase family)
MKTVLVIGANGGIGNQLVKSLLQSGSTVVGTYHINTDQVDRLKSEPHFNLQQLDLTDIESIKRVTALIKEQYSSLSAVVNCAGIVEFEGEEISTDIEIWQKTMAVNLTGNFLLGKLLYPLLEENGRLVMIGSTDAYFGGAITSAYAASKSGIDSLVKSFSLLFIDKKIRVNAIAPGWVLTPMSEANGKDFLDQVAAINPLSRNASPKDISDAIQFLLSDSSSYINGQIIKVDGGYTNQDPTLLLEEEVKQ